MVILMNENNLSKIENFIFHGVNDLSEGLHKFVRDYYNLNNKEETGHDFQEVLETIINRDPDYSRYYYGTIEDQLFEQFTK